MRKDFAWLAPAVAAIAAALAGSLATGSLISSETESWASLDRQDEPILGGGVEGTPKIRMGLTDEGVSLSPEGEGVTTFWTWRLAPRHRPQGEGDLLDSFIVSGLGVEHRILLLHPPEPCLERSPLTQQEGAPGFALDMRLESSLAPRVTDGSRSADFLDTDGRTSLRYGLVLATDVFGKEVPARLSLVADPSADRRAARGPDVDTAESIVDGDPAPERDPTAPVVLRLEIEGCEASFPVRVVLLASAYAWKEAWARDALAASVPGDRTRMGDDAARTDVESLDATTFEEGPMLSERGSSAPKNQSEEQPIAPLAPPVNDTCPGAVSIPNGSFPVLTSPVDVIDATTSGDPVFCITTDRTIWYTFMAPASGSYIVTTCASVGAAGTTMPDTVLAVYSAAGGCAAPGTAILCNDDDVTCASGMPSGRQSTVTVSLTGGSTYFIVAGRYSGVGAPAPQPGFTTIQIAVSQTLPPANDSCAGTVPVLSLDVPVEGSTFLAANDYQLSPVAPTCFTLPAPPAPVGNNASGAAGRDVVYSFQAPAPGPYSFRVTGYSTGQNLVLYAASTCPTGVSPVLLGNPPCLGAANRNGGGAAEEVMCLSLGANQRVFLFVDDHASGNAGSLFRIEASRCARETEPNGTPGTADPLACPVEGSLDPAADVDFYSVGAVPVGSRLFAVSDGAASNGSGSLGLDHVLRVTTSVDTLEFDDDDNDTPFGGLCPNVAGAPLTAAAAYIRINAFNSTVAGEPYRLYSVLQPPSVSAVAESEPNDTLANADAGGANYFSGTLAGPAPSADLDLFRFTARAGTVITLNLDGDPLRNSTPIDPALALLDATGKVVLAVSNPGSAASTSSGAGSLTATTPFSPGEGLAYRTSVTGTFYARVSIGTASTSSSGAGDYLLSVGLNCLAGDGDGDGVADAADCAAADASIWSVPSEARNFALSGHGPTSLVWSPPASPGAVAVRYDLLRSTMASNFSVANAVCLESDDTNTAASDPGARPVTGTGYYYLIRAENGCGGFMGTSSAGVPRTGRSCP